MSDDLYLKVWLDAVDAATGEPTIKFKPAANNAAAAILRERFVPRVTGPHDGLIERLELAAKQDDEAWARERWGLAAAAIASLQAELAEGEQRCATMSESRRLAVKDLSELQAELDESREALRLNMDRAHNEAKEAKLWFHKAQEWRDALERIATVDMGGGFMGSQACRAVARKAIGGKQ